MIQSFAGKTPVIAATAFVHPFALIVGDVTIGEHASIWPFASIRGERESITIGAYTNVQDNCSLHADPGEPMVIGDHVTIGHGVTMHGLSIGAHTLIGMGVTIVQGVKVGSWCLVGAGAVIASPIEVPDRSLVLGMPAKIAGQVKEKHIARLERAGVSYVKMGERYLSGEAETIE